MDFDNIPKIGADLNGQIATVFELVIDDHVPFINPTDFGLNIVGIKPLDYFITSGDAVEKSKMLFKDLKAHCNSLPDIDNFTTYKSLISDSCNKAEALTLSLITARGTAIFLETEWSDHRLRCVAKNPRPR